MAMKADVRVGFPIHPVKEEQEDNMWKEEQRPEGWRSWGTITTTGG